MQIKTTVRNHFTPTKTAIIKKTVCAGENVEKLGPSYVARTDVKWYSLCGKQFCGSSEGFNNHQMTSNSTPIPPSYLYLKSKSKTDFGCSTFKRYLLVIMAFVSYNVSDSSTKWSGNNALALLILWFSSSLSQTNIAYLPI